MLNNRGVLRHIPNILTLTNLFCGSLAIYFISLGDWTTVCWLIGIAGLADLLDGLVARALKVSSPIGAQLDSLADMVSFGLVPGMILFFASIPNRSNTISLNDTIGWSDYGMDWLMGLPFLLYPLCAALRLARFNVEDDTSGDFIGLSTPAATAVVIGFLLEPSFSFDINIIAYPYFRLIGLVFLLVVPILMISKISMFSLKFKGMGWKGNELRYIFIGLFIVLAITQPRAAILLIMLLYIVVNTILHFYQKLSS